MRLLTFVLLSSVFAAPAYAQIAAEPAAAAPACVPECRKGFMCNAGACVSLCNPPCAQNEMCLANGECAASSPPSAAVAMPVSVVPPEPVHDEEPQATSGAIEGSVFMSFGLRLVSYESASLTADGTDDAIDSSVIEVGTFGTPKLSVGYAFADAMVLAGELSLQHQTVETDAVFGDSSTGQTRFTLGPAFTYLAPGETTRFFVTGRLAVSYADTPPDVSILSFPFGASLGVHVFASEDVSIAPSAFFGYSIGSASGAFDASVSGFNVGLSLELAGWL